MTTVYWCAGMYASGSTWAYNVMRGIAAILHNGKPISSRFANVLAEAGDLDHDACVHVLKTHDVPPDAATELSRVAARIVVTVRDPRDAVTSLMLYQRFSFQLALEWVARSGKFVGKLASDARSLLLRYEAGFTGMPSTLDAIVAHFGGTLPVEERDRLFAQHSRGAIENFISLLETLPRAVRDARSGDVVDLETQWHRHHAGRSGEVGRWRRMLTPWQVAAVEREMQEWMAHFGYAPAPMFSTPAYTLRVGSFSVKL
jgi:hypothetical protein